jgi:hypothetical protein
MPIYIQPAKAAEIGRPISMGYRSGLDGLKANLKTGEVVVGLYDRLIFKLAPVLTDADEFQNFEEQYNSGMIVRREFFAFPESEIAANRSS